MADSREPSKPVRIVSAKSLASDPKQTSTNGNNLSSEPAVQVAAASGEANRATASDVRADAAAKIPTPKDQTQAYFCGAVTKKGTPCSRRVKAPGRCWQHAGQPESVSEVSAKLGK
jgi:hypothetical protein